MDGQVITASIADGLASGGFLAAFALLLGASNFQIGVMIAIPFMVQPLQIFAVMAVEKAQMRKIYAVISYFVAYSMWIPISILPFLMETPNAGAVSLMLGFIGLRGMANAFVNTSWNGWLRDIVPQDIMGKFFARRLQLATVASVVAAIGGAAFIDWWKESGPAAEIFGYSYAMLFGSILFGFTAVGFMARIPEPRMMVPDGPRRSVAESLKRPLRDRNFRQLIKFTFLWNFVAHLAVPFFTVYMLVVLEMSLTTVVALGVLSQMANVFFLRIWGPLVDQYGSKVVLSLCSSLYFLVILGWTFTTLPEKHGFTMPLLALLHMLIGIASAGINIASTTIRMKMAPKAEATSYLTTVSLAANIAAGISPLLGGAFADFFSVRQLEVSLRWVAPGTSFDLSAFNLTGFDFLFAIAFVLGLFTLASLARIREEGEADPNLVLEELLSQSRENLRVLNSVPGLSFVSNFPIRSVQRFSPIPGLDVAVGVTVHQVALSVKLAAQAITKGRSTAVRMRSKIEEIVRGAENLKTDTAGIAAGAVQGALVAAGEKAGDPEAWVRESIGLTIEILNQSGADPAEAIRGATQGAMAGGVDAGLDPAEVVTRILQVVRLHAETLGLDPAAAGKIVAEAACQFATTLPLDTADKIKVAVLESLIEFDPAP